MTEPYVRLSSGSWFHFFVILLYANSFIKNFFEKYFKFVLIIKDFIYPIRPNRANEVIYNQL